jgi:hypothetical protein
MAATPSLVRVTLPPGSCRNSGGTGLLKRGLGVHERVLTAALSSVEALLLAERNIQELVECHRAGWLSGKSSRLELGRCSVRISAGTAGIPTGFS